MRVPSQSLGLFLDCIQSGEPAVVIGPRIWSKLGDGLDRFTLTHNNNTLAPRCIRAPRHYLIKVCYSALHQGNQDMHSVSQDCFI